MYFFIAVVENHFIGRTKDITLMDGVGLGLLYNNVIVYFLGIGLVESMAVTLPKAFGNKNFRLIGIQTNQVRVIILFFFIIFVFINFFFSYDILYLIAGEDKSYIEIAHSYVIYTTPSLFLDLNFEIYGKYAESHLNYQPVVYSFIFSCFSHLISCYFLIDYLQLGVIGCGLASNLTNIVKLLTIYVHLLFFNPYPQSDFFFDKKILDWKSFSYMLKVSLMSMVTYFAECCGFSISNIVANKLPKLSYAKYLTLSNIISINYSIAYGWMNTTSILVSNFIGENSPKKIKKSINYLLITGVLTMIPVLLAIFFFRENFYFFFSEEPSIYLDSGMINYLIYFVLITCAFDFLQSFLIGILRGCEILTFTTVASSVLFLIFHPIASTYMSLYLKMDISGILISEGIVYASLITLWIYYIMCRLDMKKICEEYQGDEEEEELEKEIF
jgi:multidrug resistance protein, MATE family